MSKACIKADAAKDSDTCFIRSSTGIVAFITIVMFEQPLMPSRSGWRSGYGYFHTQYFKVFDDLVILRMAVAVSCFPARLQDIKEGQTSIRMLLGELHEMLCSWREQAAKLETGEISKEDYDEWRYHYPDLDIYSI